MWKSGVWLVCVTVLLLMQISVSQTWRGLSNKEGSLDTFSRNVWASVRKSLDASSSSSSSSSLLRGKVDAAGMSTQGYRLWSHPWRDEEKLHVSQADLPQAQIWRQNFDYTSEHPFCSFLLQGAGAAHMLRLAHGDSDSVFTQPDHNRPCYQERSARNGNAAGGVLCLADVYMIAPQKSGTTDVFKRLEGHPAFEFGSIKEPQWWTKLLPDMSITGTRNSIYKYMVLQYGASNVAKFKDSLRFDASASTMYGHSSVQGQCRVPDIIHTLAPHSKFMAILREPAARAYSDYTFFMPRSMSTSSDEAVVAKWMDAFAENVPKQIAEIKLCVAFWEELKADHDAVYAGSAAPELPGAVERTELERRARFWVVIRNGKRVLNTDWTPIEECSVMHSLGNVYGRDGFTKHMFGRVLLGVYFPFLKSFFEVAGADHTFVSCINCGNMAEIVRNAVAWLGYSADDIQGSQWESEDHLHSQEKARKAKRPDMPPEAKKALQAFYAPWNHKLLQYVRQQYSSSQYTNDVVPLCVQPSQHPACSQFIESWWNY